MSEETNVEELERKKKEEEEIEKKRAEMRELALKFEENSKKLGGMLRQREKNYTNFLGSLFGTGPNSGENNRKK